MSYMIVSRDFWPNAAAIGNGLFKLAKDLACYGETSVVTMSHSKEEIKQQSGRCNFLIAKPLTHSGSKIVLRVFEIGYFVLWLIFALVRKKPSNVYVATNPPILIPFVVAIYAFLFNKSFTYHIQDIHPEASTLIFKLPRSLVVLLKKIDTWSLNQAETVITLTEEMKSTLVDRGCIRPIFLLENPSDQSNFSNVEKISGVIYAGTAGRLQNMDIVIPAIEQYLSDGGGLSFAFIGGGVYASELTRLANTYSKIEYFGKVDGLTALSISAKYAWGLLPINGEVLRYAYPSKIPSYLSAGCRLICCTDLNSSLVKWINKNDLGVCASQDQTSLIDAFRHVESISRGDVRFSGFFISTSDFSSTLSSIIRASNDSKSRF